TYRSSNYFFATGYLSDDDVFLNRFRSVVATFVIKVQTNGRISDLNRFYSQIYQTFSEFTVLTSVLHFFVKSVDCYEVFFPTRSIVTVPSWAGWSKEIQ